MQQKIIATNDGHRQRLRERLLNNFEPNLPDSELLEIILFPASPRRDVKPLAKQLLQQFGGLNAVFDASKEELCKVRGMNLSAIANIKVAKALAIRLIKNNFKDRPVLQSWKGVLDYLRATMAHLRHEEFRLLFLNKKNILIADEPQPSGTIDRAPIYPREIIRRAIALEAAAIIMVHNHPSGDVRPSSQDIKITREIMHAASFLGIELHDHVIISLPNHYSFKAHGLI